MMNFISSRVGHAIQGELMPSQPIPTDKQIAALIKFGIPQGEVAKMTFEQASAKLSELITKAKAHDAHSNQSSQQVKQAKPFSQSVASPADAAESPIQAVARMIHQARILKTEQPTLEDFDGYPYLLAETLKALSFKESEAWEEKMMAEKIKA